MGTTSPFWWVEAPHEPALRRAALQSRSGLANPLRLWRAPRLPRLANAEANGYFLGHDMYQRATYLMLAGCLLLLAPDSRATAAEPLVRLPTQTATFIINGLGRLDSIRAEDAGRNYVVPDQPAPLLSLRLKGQWHTPTQATWNETNHTLHLAYESAQASATLSALVRTSHVAFAVTDVQPADAVDLVLWGPYPIAITNIVGEIVGVVRDPEFAVGIQALNARTLGGYPARESDIVQEFGAKDLGIYADFPPELTEVQGFRGDTARATDFGSVLQAYTRDRSRERAIENWGHDAYVVPAFEDGGVVGSRIALFACPAPQALDTIGAIEVAEGLPHPMLDGVWAKQSPHATASYLIVDFSEDTIDRAIAMTRQAGLKWLYHSSPFSTWGHFQLKPDLFPSGPEGLRRCVEKAGAAGVHVGVHTLSNFITPQDAYVAPKPDPRLAVVGSTPLTQEVDAVATELPVAQPDWFAKGSTLNTVRVGEELIRFKHLSAAEPWRLLECQRGAWGTKAAPHEKGDKVARLLDHPYEVFFGNADLSREIARHLAALFNVTGVRQISFDGLEGNWATGHGQYGRILFTQSWHDALKPGLQGTVINDASNPGHFNWHINTRMNWGEPWYAGFRESQTLYRFKNQVLFERNFMPPMLGWFALRPDTSVEDAGLHIEFRTLGAAIRL